MITRICSSGVLGEELVFCRVLQRGGFSACDVRDWERGRSEIVLGRYSTWMRASAAEASAYFGLTHEKKV
jgi:hypothetical protein